jgi:hypothetical protein
MTHPLDELIEKLDQLDGRRVVVGIDRSIVRGGRDRDIEDLTERVSKELARKLRREGLL